MQCKCLQCMVWRHRHQTVTRRLERRSEDAQVLDCDLTGSHTQKQRDEAPRRQRCCDHVVTHDGRFSEAGCAELGVGHECKVCEAPEWHSVEVCRLLCRQIQVIRHT
jgi:hypothetical protein